VRRLSRRSGGFVDAGDLAILLGGWGPSFPGDPADIDLSGQVDASDLAALLGNWGACAGG
jgi:hypothetical protein